MIFLQWNDLMFFFPQTTRLINILNLFLKTWESFLDPDDMAHFRSKTAPELAED